MFAFEFFLITDNIGRYPVRNILGKIFNHPTNGHIGITNPRIIIDATEGMVEIQGKTSLIGKAIHDLVTGGCIGIDVVGFGIAIGCFLHRHWIVPTVVAQVIRLSIALVHR